MNRGRPAPLGCSLLHLIADQVFLLVILCIFSVFSFANQSNIRFEKYSLEHGLSQDAVFAILQDQKGFMWFATQEGLNRFDGYQFKSFYHVPNRPSSLSHNSIYAMIEDHDGGIWLGTDGGGLNRYDYTTEQFEHYTKAEHGLASDRINTLFMDSEKNLWIGTEGGGLSKLGPNQKFAENFHANEHPGETLSSNFIRVLAEDQWGHLLIGTDKGISIFSVKDNHQDVDALWQFPEELSDASIRALLLDQDERLWVGTHNMGLFLLEGETVQHFTEDESNPYGLCANRVRDLYLNSRNEVWVATDKGLCLWQENRRRFVQYRHHTNDLHSVSDNRVLSLFEDRGGVMWAGTFGGINKWRNTNIYHFRQLANDAQSISSNVVTAFTQDTKNDVWVGTYEGLNRYDASTQSFKRFEGEVLQKTFKLTDERIMSLHADSHGDLWVGTRSGGASRLNIATGESILFQYDPGSPSGITGNGITAIYEDKQKRIWLAVYGGGINLFERITGNFTHVRHEPGSSNTISTDRVLSLFQSQDQLLWVGTEGGGINSIDIVSGEIKQYRHDPNNNESLSNDVAWSFAEDHQGNLWIGTWGGGLNKWHFQDRVQGIERFTHYGKPEGLPSSVIYDLKVDASGKLWLSSNRGLTKLDPTNDEMQHFDVSHGLQDYEFTKGAAFKDNIGNLYFGGANGFNQFNPTRIALNSHAPEVQLNKILLMNQEVSASIKQSGLPEIAMDHKDYIVAFEFAALDFTAPSKNRYQYKVEGLQENWVDMDNTRRITLTNLPSGNFILNIKASNNDGVWSEPKKALQLTVSPPPWKSWWAYTLYGLFGCSVFLYYLWSHKQKLKEKAEYSKQLESEVQQRTEELTEANHQLAIARDQAEVGNRSKGAFIANMSHEFRTPMTSIIGFTESLLDNKAVPNPEKNRRLSKVLSNAKHMLHLINKILDLSKIEVDKLDIEHISLSPGLLMLEVEELISQQATNKGLQFNLLMDYPVPAQISGDPVRLKQILLNLCSNSIKFTECGSITLHMFCNDSQDKLVFSIKDTGIGIAEEKLGTIFDSFSQADSSTTRKYGGTGLGLSISSQLVKLMGGALKVNSQLGSGSEFCFDITLETEQDGTWIQSDSELAELKRQSKENTVSVPLLSGDILLAEDWEDNQDLIKMLVTECGANITVVENGQEAVETALSGEFDLVLMDIQMPLLDGASAMQFLRASGFSRPIIALTANVAKSDVDNYLSKGFTGVLAKPIEKHVFYQTLMDHLVIPDEQNVVQLTAKPEKKLAENFIRKLPELLDKIYALMNRDEWEGASRLLHNLKGLGGSFGFPQITEQTQLVQGLLAQNKLKEAKESFLKIMKKREELVSQAM